MKRLFPICWWPGAVGFLALLFVSLGHPAPRAVALAVLFLPGMLCARYFLPQLAPGRDREYILHAVCLALAVLCTQYLSLLLGLALVLDASPDEVPPLLLNPFFLLLVLSALVTPGMAIEKYLERRQPYDTTIRFVSERRKVALDPGEIRYVESNDSEVRIHTVSGEIYRTKTRISQWEAQLDGRFLRIHRSYIVNTERIDRYLPSYVLIGDERIHLPQIQGGGPPPAGRRIERLPARKRPPDREPPPTSPSPRPHDGSSGRRRADAPRARRERTTTPFRSPPRSGAPECRLPPDAAGTSACA